MVTEIDMIEINAMIISIIALINFPFIIKKRKDFIKYLPGIVSLIVVFIFGFLDDVFEFEIFEILESICILSGALLLLIASLIDLNEIFFKDKIKRINHLIQKSSNGESND